MALAIVYSRANAGLAAPLVTVEAHISRGMPGLHIVGLPETAVKESKDRVRSALLNTHFEFPARRMTINLAPADLPKEGGRFDLPIALGILAASGQIPMEKLSQCEWVGELALSGELRSVRGVFALALAVSQTGRQLIVPFSNKNEAALVKQADVFAAKHLLDVCAHIKNERVLPRCEAERVIPSRSELDLSDIRGQAHAKRALEIAAAGKHSMLLIGPPGTGKTMLASRLPGLLPALTDQQLLEVASIASVSSAGFDHQKWHHIPFRAPHHTSSGVALVGGGRPPRPGEISLAHHGVLFLDELLEFNRQVLECLREPLESGKITISRAACQAIFPAEFQLIAAMNPCPCGLFGSARGGCRCSEDQIRRYLTKLSGPLLDRMDMQVEVPSVPPDLLSSDAVEGPSETAIVKTRVVSARQRQYDRQGKLNQSLAGVELHKACLMEAQSKQLLATVMNKFQLSARAYHRIVKLARTIADLADHPNILTADVAEALTYRCLDRLKQTDFG